VCRIKCRLCTTMYEVRQDEIRVSVCARQRLSVCQTRTRIRLQLSQATMITGTVTPRHDHATVDHAEANPFTGGALILVLTPADWVGVIAQPPDSGHKCAFFLTSTDLLLPLLSPQPPVDPVSPRDVIPKFES
jgi:hypothetical protein